MPSIAGTITKEGQPLGKAYVRLVGPSGEFVAEEYTPDDGSFRFHVVEGTWTLEVRAPGVDTRSKSVDIAGEDAAVSIEI